MLEYSADGAKQLENPEEGIHGFLKRGVLEVTLDPLFADLQMPQNRSQSLLVSAKDWFRPPVEKGVYSTEYQRLSHCRLYLEKPTGNRKVQWKSLRLAASQVFELS